MIERKFTLSLLRGAVSAYENHGHVIALVGESGCGKSVVVQQFIEKHFAIVTIHSPKESIGGDVSPLPALEGFCVIDDAWRFPNAKATIWSHTRNERQIVIIVCQDVREAYLLCEQDAVTIIPVSHWKIEATQQIPSKLNG